MMDSLSSFLGAILTSYLCMFLSSKILNSKINYKKLSFWGTLLLQAVYLFFIYFAINSFIRIIMNLLVTIGINKFYFKTPWNRATISSVIVMLIVMISEMMIGIIVFGIFRISMSTMKTILFSELLGNSLSFLICLLLYDLICKFIKVDNILLKIDKGMHSSVAFYGIIILITCCILFNLIYYEASLAITMILYGIIFILYGIIITSLLHEKQENIKNNVKFEAALKDLREYEKLLDDQRAKAHDNNNDWISVRGMLKDNKVNSEAIEYIEQVLKDNKKTDKSILSKTAIIPYGGLQGLVYKKLLKMKEKGIKYTLNLSRDLKNKKFSKLDAEKNKNICTIVGILLDNAIEASAMCDDKQVAFSMYSEEGYLNIKLLNTYKGVIDLSRIDDKKYSTKGQNRGYGLPNVKEIISRTDYITNEREINGKYFVQIIKIKM